MATGVLVVGVGRATRMLGHLSGTTKSYDATIRLGATTTTDDAEGETLDTTDASDLGRREIELAAARFVGDIDQVPSTVSAIKVDGKRAYARVRAGEAVALDARPVHVDDFAVHRVRPAPPYVDVDASVTCSAGTYVRALARDLGADLDVGGHLTALRRTRVGGFTLADASTLDELADDWTLVPLAEAARRSFPSHELSSDEATWVRHGRALPDVRLPADDVIALYDPSGEFLALYRQDGSTARPVVVFAA